MLEILSTYKRDVKDFNNLSMFEEKTPILKINIRGKVKQ